MPSASLPHLPVRRPSVDPAFGTDSTEGVEDQRPVLLGKDAGPASMNQQVGILRGKKAWRRRSAWIGEQSVLDIEELGAVLAKKRPVASQ